MIDSQSASDFLYAAWQEGRAVPELPAPLRPTTRAEGYAIQALIEKRSTFPLAGWKIAATSDAGQKHIGVDGPLAGRLLRERMLADGAALPLGHCRMRVIEAEFAFRMGRTLVPRGTLYSIDEVRDAVAALHLAIEIQDSRYEVFTKVGASQLIADNGCAHWFVLGPEAPARWRGLDLAAHKVIASIAGGESRDGVGANVLGGPLIALTWIANELSSIGAPLAQDQVVITGTCIAPLPVAVGNRVTVDFGALGRVSVNFT